MTWSTPPGLAFYGSGLACLLSWLGVVNADCRGLVGNNLPTYYQCTIMILTKFLPIMIGTNWKNKYFVLHW